jgi:hypothetical protein
VVGSQSPMYRLHLIGDELSSSLQSPFSGLTDQQDQQGLTEDSCDSEVAWRVSQWFRYWELVPQCVM